MPKAKKMLREGGRTYTTFHVRPYSSKREAEKRAKAVLPVPLPTKIKKEDGGYWAYILTPTNLDDFPAKMKIGRQMYDLHAAFTKREKATERKRLEERQGRSAKIVNAISLRGATYFAVYIRPSAEESKKMAEAVIRKEKPVPKERVVYRGFTYRRIHENPVKSKKRVLQNLKEFSSSPPTPHYILKTAEGYWAYILDPKNKSDFPKSLKIDKISCEFHAGFTDVVEAHECRRKLRIQGKPTKQIYTGVGRDGYWGIYTVKLPPLSITGKWYGHKLPMQLFRGVIFETKKTAEGTKQALREKGEVVQIKPFGGWYALYHTKGFGESHKPEVKYATTMTKVEKHNAKRDGKRRAHPAGKRVSKFGKVYYEYRENRADGPAELEEKWGKEKAGKWAKVEQPKKTKKSVAGRLIAIGGKEWTGGAGYHRIYFNDLPGLYGLRASRYKTGSISSASFRGESISNSRARRIEGAFAFSKLWYDVGSRKFECKGMDEEDKAWIVAEIKKRAKI